MATNKNAFVRYKILDSCFRNFGKRYFIENLIEKCNKELRKLLEKASKLNKILVTKNESVSYKSEHQDW